MSTSLTPKGWQNTFHCLRWIRSASEPFLATIPFLRQATFMTLDQVQVGTNFTIIGVQAHGEIRKRLVDMGFIRGAHGKVLRKALLGDPIELRLGSYLVSVRTAEAENIEVQN